jgi:hypothetical protein
MADSAVLVVASVTAAAGLVNLVAAFVVPKPTPFQRHVFSMFEWAWKLGVGYLLRAASQS